MYIKPDQINLNSRQQENEPLSFNKLVILNKELTLQETVDLFAKIHSNSTTEDILDAFSNLKSAYENNKNAKVIFKKAAGVLGVLSMNIFDENGTLISNSKVNEHSGQPMAHWS